MRGTLQEHVAPGTSVGLIPTYAGNTGLGANHVCMPRAHPHVCGEHGLFTPNVQCYAGSSPRMRGTRRWQGGHQRLGGLIPTYAGNTMPLTRPMSTIWAHPHVCREHRAMELKLRLAEGSSPRMRGTRETRGGGARPPGLIPTYAGNTLFKSNGVTMNRAHPHVCGEHFFFASVIQVYGGSSPRMRGTPR